RHAEHYRDVFEQAEAETATRSTAEWLGLYAWRIDNLRTPPAGAFSPSGGAAIGGALTGAAVRLWFQQSLLAECRLRAEQARETLGTGPGRDAGREMVLSAAHGGLLNQATV